MTEEGRDQTPRPPEKSASMTEGGLERVPTQRFQVQKEGLKMSMCYVRQGAYVVSVIVAVVLLPFLKGSYGGCDCSDCTNLQNRYRQVNALLAEICQERQEVANMGQKDSTYNDDIYNDNMLKNWKDAMGNVKDPYATIFPSGQTNAFCQPSYQGHDDNSCMLASVTSHEAVHVATCKRVRANRPGCVGVWRQDFFQKGYMDCMTWDEFMADEINAYNAELNYLASEINALRPVCQAMGQWCLTPDPGLPPSTCPPTVNTVSLFMKMVAYVFDR